MKRTSRLTGLIFPALLAVVPACDDDHECIALQFACDGICVDTTSNPSHCGACGAACTTGQSCVASECTAGCTPPEMACGSGCVDTQTSVTDCGGCGTACAVNGECVAGQCQDPLALIQTSLLDRTTDRDLYLLEDRSFELIEINGTSFANGTVADHAILPGGDVLMVAAQDTDGVYELYRVSPRGGARTKLSAPLVAGGDVQPGLTISADGRKVLYRADQDTDDVIDLYAVELARPGVTVKVNGALTAGGDVSRVVAVSANGNRAAYIADQEADDLNEAYTVDLSAAAPGPSVKINLDFGTSIYDLQMSRDGAKIVYRNGGFPSRLWAVDTATPGTSEPIVNSDGGEGYVEGYQLAADGAAVFYTSAVGFLDESLWVAPLAAPPLDSTLLIDGAGANAVRRDFVVTADAARVYFRQIDADAGYERLYRMDVATPGTRTPLSSDADDPAADVSDFALSRDGRHLAFRGGADGPEGGFPLPGTDPPLPGERYAPALYHVDLSAAAPGAPVLLSPPIGKGEEGIGAGYVVTDDRRVLFRADLDQASFSDLYLAATATAGTVRKVSPPLDQTTDATDVSLVTLF